MSQKRRYRFKGCPSKDQLYRSCIWSTIKVHFSIDTRQPWCQATCVWKINFVHTPEYVSNTCLKETLQVFIPSCQLRQFHARCVRTLSRTNLYHAWIHHISTTIYESGGWVGFRFDEQLYIARPPTSIMMLACACISPKPYAFWSSSQAHALEDNISHPYGIHPRTPSLFVLSLSPAFSFWWVVEPMLRGRRWH